jgi:hypothetical protein
VGAGVSKQEPFLVFRVACYFHFLRWQEYLRQVLIMFLCGRVWVRVLLLTKLS